jgi:hypothetical protein
MNCNCFKRIVNELEEVNPKWKNITIDSMFSGMISGMICKQYPYVKVYYDELKKNGKKLKHKRTNIMANFCPFCGVGVK